MVTTAGQNTVSQGTLAEVPVRCAPSSEQKRIVAKIEELTARSRRAKEALDAVAPLLDQLRQSILAAAFRGDLTADWRAKNPNVEPADKLIARIRAERRAARLDPVGHGEVPPPLPMGWAWSTVGELCEVGTGATPKRDNGRYWDRGDIPWVTSGATNEEYVDEATELVTKTALDETNLTLFPAGTLLVAMYGEGQTRGRCTELRINATTNQALAGLVTHHLPPPVKELVKFVLWERYQSIRRAAAGGVQPNLNLSIIRAIPVPVPPLAEQAVLIPLVRESLARVSRLAEGAQKQSGRLASLDQTILAKAFRGELVPQDPGDEPASVLLDRIRAGSGSRRRSRKVEEAAVQPEKGDADDGRDALASPSRSTPGTRAAKDISDLDPDSVLDEVFAALWTRGSLEKDDAVRQVAEHLRTAGYIEFQRLRSDGPLYAQILGFIEAAVKAGRLDRPKRGQVRACKPDATTFTADDWRLSLVASLGAEPFDRDDAIRVAAEWARDNLGLEFSRLRSDGHIVLGLRSALNSAIRRGEITRHDATRISRAADDPQQTLPGMMVANAGDDRRQVRTSEDQDV